MNPNIADVAKILSIESVSSIVIVLFDGRFHTVTELAKAGNIKRNTASYHIKKMQALNWIEEEQHGKYHYYRLCNPDVANIAEQLMRTASIKTVRSLNESSEQKILFNARTCYDHLAGKVGVELTNWFILKNYIMNKNKEVFITKEGNRFFTENIGLDLEKLIIKKRKFAVMCLDWSERKHHLAGSLGNAILNYLLENGWVEHCGKSRGLRITEYGKIMFLEKWNAAEFLDRL